MKKDPEYEHVRLKNAIMVSRQHRQKYFLMREQYFIYDNSDEEDESDPVMMHAFMQKRKQERADMIRARKARTININPNENTSFKQLSSPEREF
eukprot:CAMPEP_0176354166 /NCGR_PEP_ID=MMETSP0126-20121128/12349_1 /TAXON_ID=141414 ORGANISM="Strombidinopsis acuminatum, Strain SPMC142" /NCGR_SAMPLE_ID=MMETSP0126 /ASSEMBLY_ACC=CAM_ASM_000229 /LENGTH=93 /DNA_ID=CAMNT_0017706197 /DNA_START=1059 /DNA_END=1340 /DNA_ORIENTATION=+